MFRDSSASPFRLGLLILFCLTPAVAMAQTSPFLTGATALQTNILAWLTPIAIILVMALGAMAMANRIAQVSSSYGNGEANTIVENSGNSLILRCAGSENGGTSAFAARLIGEREVIRRHYTRGRESAGFGSGHRGSRSRQMSDQRLLEQAVLASEIEQLPDLCGYLKVSSAPHWRRVRLRSTGTAT